MAEADSRRNVVPERRQRVFIPVRLSFAHGCCEGVPEVARPSALLLSSGLYVDVGRRVWLSFALGRNLQDLAVDVGEDAGHPLRSAGIEADGIIVAPGARGLSRHGTSSAVVVVKHLRDEVGDVAAPYWTSL